MNKKLLSFYSLKYNPFIPEIPTEAFYQTTQIESFCWRIRQQTRDGGYALIWGEPGSGKSITMRILEDSLAKDSEIIVATLSRPQASIPDFYRELGDLFSVSLSAHNRWGGTKVLREKWTKHMESSLYRPVLIIDEVQEMKVPVLNELRLLSSSNLDSRSMLTVILCGDARFCEEQLRHPALLPLGSRIRFRIHMHNAGNEDMLKALRHMLKTAGNASLMTKELMQTICEHSRGNFRLMSNMAGELLLEGFHQQHQQLDEKLFLNFYSSESSPHGQKEK